MVKPAVGCAVKWWSVYTPQPLVIALCLYINMSENGVHSEANQQQCLEATELNPTLHPLPDLLLVYSNPLANLS